jgi:hypothetical protein
VRSHAQPLHLGRDPLGVVVLVGADRLLVGTKSTVSLLLGRIPLAVAIGQRYPAIHHQIIIRK